MKAITIKQPWAHLICAGAKDIENRTWPTKYRGRVLIHASAKPVNTSKPELVFSKEQFSSLSLSNKVQCITKGTSFIYMSNSVIIGSVEIVDCVVNHPSIWAEKSIDCKECVDVENCPLGKCPHITYNWVLANPILFDKPITGVKGKLSFWDFKCPKCGSELIELKSIGSKEILCFNGNCDFKI